jgi:hypothetical protein
MDAPAETIRFCVNDPQAAICHLKRILKLLFPQSMINFRQWISFVPKPGSLENPGARMTVERARKYRKKTAESIDLQWEKGKGERMISGIEESCHNRNENDDMN